MREPAPRGSTIPASMNDVIQWAMASAPMRWAAVAVSIAVLAPSVARADDLDSVRQKGVLRWGADAEGGAPFVFNDPKDPDRLLGFEVEIAEDLAKRLGVKAEMAQNNWAELVPGLERGDFDIVL